MTGQRKAISVDVKREVLMEAGYKCAVPVCRTILALDLHHMVEVKNNGSNEASNLLALCPNCHSLFHRGVISREAIYSWKSILIALNHAFDHETIDILLFLYKVVRINNDFKLPRSNGRPDNELLISGDGVLKFSRLIASGLAIYKLELRNGPINSYSIELTEKGEMLVAAWLTGKKHELELALHQEYTN